MQRFDSDRIVIFMFTMSSLFHILMIKTSYHQLENFERIKKPLEKSLINPIFGYEIKYNRIVMPQVLSKITIE